MSSGFTGTFVISWTQTELDGQDAPPLGAMAPGCAWSWHGQAIRVDGPSTLLRLDGAQGAAQLRKRAAGVVRRLVGTTLGSEPAPTRVEVDLPFEDQVFVVTNGVKSYAVTVIHQPHAPFPLLMFLDDMPPPKTELWVVRHTLTPQRPRTAPGGVICFAKGTRIRTPNGPRLIEELREGNLVITKDNGPQEIRWIGSRHMSGARLHAMPDLRPVRIRAGALGLDQPDETLLVSPDHRLVVRGAVARALFNTPEVLVAARDLVDDRAVIRDTTSRDVTYVHLLLPRHEVIFANGVETESFHPASSALSTLSESDRARLSGVLPGIDTNPQGFGPLARRNLSRSEAAILMHDAA